MKKFALLLLVSVTLYGKTFRIAALYPTTEIGHINCTCGYEAACITEAAVERARKQGYDVSLEVFQTDRNAIGALEAAEKAVNRNFDAVVGTLVSTEAIPVSEVLEKAHIPFITPTATNPQVTIGRKYAARIPFNDYRQSFLLARLSVRELKAKRIAVVRNTSSPYSDFLGQEYPKKIKELLPSARIFEFSIIDGFSANKDLAVQILQSKPDLIFVPLSQAQITSLYVELAALKPSVIILGSDTIEGKPEFLDLLGPKTIHFIYPKHWNGKLDGPASDDYLSLLKDHCSQYVPSMPSGAAYDAITLLLNAYKKAPTARGLKLMANIRRTHFEGMMGPIHFGHDGDPVKPIELFEVNDGDAHYWMRYE